MTSRARRTALGLLATVAAFAFAAPGAADWLVRRDGGRTETAGPWRLRDGRVHYTDGAGRPQSLPARDVDLAASARLSLERQGGKPAGGLAAAAAATRAERATRAPAVAAIEDHQIRKAEVTEAAPGTDAAATVEPVVLFTTSWCPWCRKAKELLGKLGVPYVERDVERDPAARAAMQRIAPGHGVPVLVRGDEVIRGYDAAAIRRLAGPAAAAGG